MSHMHVHVHVHAHVHAYVHAHVHVVARWYEVEQKTSKKAATKTLVRRTQLAVWKSRQGGGVTQAVWRTTMER